MKRALLIISSFAIVVGLVVCSKPTPVNITELNAGDTVLVPGQNTILHCIVEDTTGVTYSWSASLGTIEGMGDSATWTAPDFLWSTTVDTVTVIATNKDSESDTAIIELTVEVSFNAYDATDDTYAYSAYPSNSYGDGEYLLVGYEESEDGYFRSFIRFLTPPIPSGESFRRARLKLYREYFPTDTLYMLFYSISSDWQGGSLNWNNQPNTSSSSFAAYTDTIAAVGTFYVDVTPAVQNWIAGINNYGIMIRAKDEIPSAGRRDYGSKDGDASKRPALEVVSW